MNEGTLVYCPQCGGICVQTAAQYFTDQFSAFPLLRNAAGCTLCNGSGWVTPEVSREYSLRLKKAGHTRWYSLIVAAFAVLLILALTALLPDGINPFQIIGLN